MDKATWDAVDGYFLDAFIEEDDVLREVVERAASAGLPPIQVSAALGGLLNLLVRTTRATRILEVGTLAGYSSIWMARALPAEGRLVTLEIDPAHAAVASESFKRAGLDGKTEVRVGPAIETLPSLQPGFDLAFIDADKQSTTEYFSHALRLVRPGGVVIVDNVVRGGEVVQDDTADESALGIRRFVDSVRSSPRVSGTAIQTVGTKGYDGFAVFVVEGSSAK